MERQSFFKKISKETMKCRICPHCHCVTPTVQKIPKVSGKIEVKSSSMYYCNNTQESTNLIIKKETISTQ